jgi:hypothetical protein
VIPTSFTIDPPSLAAPAVVRKRQTFLHKAFWGGVAAFVLSVALTCHPQSVESACGAAIIMVASLLPSWMWLTGKVQGLPLFPVFAATFLPTFAMPLLYEHPIVILFSPWNQFVAALTAAGFLFLSAFVWWEVAKRPSRAPRRCLVLNAAAAELFFLGTLAAGCLFAVASYGNWINFSPGISSIIRAIVLALEALACFVLSFRSGAGQLVGEKRVLFRILFVALLISTLPGLLLVGAMSFSAVAALGFTLGARRFPWRSGLVAVLLFVLLHAGKGPMREIYWQEDEDPTIQPTAYPSFFLQWVAISWRNFFDADTEGIESQSLLERASLMQLLLYVQAMTPDVVPFMEGDTYTVIPGLLIPRIFSEEKLASHEGTYRLNIHYGFQTRDDTAKTTIGFGLLNEAYANFGFVGVGMLAILLGAYYGVVERWARMAPVLSFRSLFAVIVASYAFQTEFAASVYVTALFQSTVALIIIAVLFMRTRECGATERSILE